MPIIHFMRVKAIGFHLHIITNAAFHVYRIKMCTDVTHKDFITVHHELAHIQYFLNYRNNPKVFRDGANPGRCM